MPNKKVDAKSNSNASTKSNSLINSKKSPNLPNLYHNPTKLLKSYRSVRLSLKLSMEQHQQDFEAEYGMTITQYLDDIYAAGIEFAGTKLEHHANTMKRTAKMLELIDKSAHLIKNYNSEGEVSYWILYYTYLSPQKPKDLGEIVASIQAHIPYITADTYFKYRKKAIKLFSSVLWGYATKNEAEVFEAFVPHDPETPASASAPTSAPSPTSTSMPASVSTSIPTSIPALPPNLHHH